jgi:hypothetical protein
LSGNATGNHYADSGLDVPDYCRQIEAYLCRKNDGHLIRVVGPSFEIVSRWAAQGVPLKVAFRGIDRYFERYYRNGPRRRPVRIDFCEADVLETFDQWRRALGLMGQDRREGQEGQDGREGQGARRRSGSSLPEHLERVLVKLTSARATGALGADADTLIDRVVGELDIARAAAGGLRGEVRRTLLDRLAALDRELLQAVSATLSDEARRGLAREADRELAAFHATMSGEAFQRVHAAAVDRLVRERFDLPTLTYV